MTDPTGSLPEELTVNIDAKKHTERINAAVLKELPFSDRTSFENAARCLVAI